MPGGRPTEYKPEYVERAAKLCSLGATDLEIAHEFKVSIATLYNWRAKYPEFLEAIKLNRQVADERVEGMLYRRATGYSFESVKIFCKDGEVTLVPYTEHVPPDVTAQIFWLKNRRRDEWRDKTDTEVSGNVGLQIISSVPRPPKKEE